MLKKENEKNFLERVVSKQGKHKLNKKPFPTIMYYSDGIGICQFLQMLLPKLREIR